MKCDWPPPRLTFAGWSVLFTSYFAVGYHGAVLNVGTRRYMSFINDSVIQHYGSHPSTGKLYMLYSVVVSLWQIGCILGTLLSYWLAQRIGRKHALLTVASSLQIAGSFMMSASFSINSFELLAAGRLLAGISSGVICPTLRVFLCECSPDAYRGVLNGPGGIVLSIASVLAMGLSQPGALGSLPLLPYLLGVCVVPSVLQILLGQWLPQSPKYLYINKNDARAAISSIYFYHGADANIPKLVSEYEMERRLSDEELPIWKAWHQPSVRRSLVLSAVVALAHSSIGVDVVLSYSVEIFSKLGMPTEEAGLYSMFYEIPGIFGGILAVALVDRWDRRPLLLSTFGLCIVYNLIFIVLMFVAHQFGYRVSLGLSAVVLTGLLEFVYSLGPGAVAETLFAEFSPQNVRVASGSIGEFTFWFSNAVFVFAFPPLLNAIGPYSMLIYTIPLVLSTLYLALKLPETARKSVLQIVSDMASDDTESENDHHGNLARNLPIPSISSDADFMPILSDSLNTASTLNSRSSSVTGII